MILFSRVTFSTVFVGGHVGAFLCILWQRYGRCVVMDVWVISDQ